MAKYRTRLVFGESALFNQIVKELAACAYFCDEPDVRRCSDERRRGTEEEEHKGLSDFPDALRSSSSQFVP